MVTAPVLTVEELSIDIAGRRVIDGLDLALAPESVTALVGRSGSGKSLTARALVRSLPRGATAAGRAELVTGESAAVDLLGLPERRVRALRGAAIGYVFQEAGTSLNPTVTVGRHIRETLRAHGLPMTRGVEVLREAGLEAPGAIDRAYPFELSGGQAQRVALALARAPAPRVLIADEITSALDPITQAGVLDTLRVGAASGQRAVLMITHDLAVARRWADRVAVLDGGRIVESGPSRRVLAEPDHPFTTALVRASGLGGAASGAAAGARRTMAGGGL